MYKDLINRLRATQSRSKRQLLDAAADAIEALQKNDPLTLDELRELHGDPVWCEERKQWEFIYVGPDGVVGAYPHPDDAGYYAEYFTYYRQRPKEE